MERRVVVSSPITLHLITQRDQPYGSVRKCCEACGAYGALKEPDNAWTDEPETHAKPPPEYRACNAEVPRV